VSRTRTARQRIERAFHVSFKLPEQAAALLDDYRAEVRAEYAAELSAAVRSVPVPTEAGRHWHWVSFAFNRAADTINYLATKENTP
jgi:hypothetical protein